MQTLALHPNLILLTETHHNQKMNHYCILGLSTLEYMNNSFQPYCTFDWKFKQTWNNNCPLMSTPHQTASLGKLCRSMRTICAVENSTKCVIFSCNIKAENVIKRHLSQRPRRRLYCVFFPLSLCIFIILQSATSY